MDYIDFRLNPLNPRYKQNEKSIYKQVKIDCFCDKKNTSKQSTMKKTYIIGVLLQVSNHFSKFKIPWASKSNYWEPLRYPRKTYIIK